MVPVLQVIHSYLIKVLLHSIAICTLLGPSTFKERISLRREVNVKSWEDLWDAYCRLHREMKELVRERS